MSKQDQLRGFEMQMDLNDLYPRGDPPSASGLDPRVAVEDPEAPVEFRIHQCWTMMFCWPADDNPNDPGYLQCQGCGRRWELKEVAA